MSYKVNGSEKKKSKTVKQFMPVVIALVLVGGMFLGGKLQQTMPNKTNPLQKVDRQKLSKMLELIDQKYVDSTDYDDLVGSAISGILKKLDPHSVFVAAQDFDNVNENLEGNFEGIGIRFFIVNDTIMVVSPITGGPSADLGIKPGDKIILIEGEQAAGVGITDRDVVNKLRGPKGSEVTVDILRVGHKDLLNFTIVRDRIPLFSLDVSYMINSKVGFIKVSHFSKTTKREFADAISKLKKSGMEDLILDLRRNPGGFLHVATAFTDDFLSSGKLMVYTEGVSSPRFEYTATKKGSFEDGKLVILIDEGSASASEIVAGAVQDWDRGVIVGRRSFGKGFVQDQFKFSDGSALRLTVSRWYTPAGRCIQKSYKEGNEAYYHEAFERFERGELVDPDSIKIADSLKFITPTGKIVFGGGGILPDVFVPIDTNKRSDYFRAILRERLLTQFAYLYVPKHLSFFNKFKDAKEFSSKFKIDAKLMREFVSYISDHGVVFDKKGFSSSEEEIKILLRANMAQQLWKNDGYYPIINEMDDGFKKAFEVITSM